MIGADMERRAALKVIDSPGRLPHVLLQELDMVRGSDVLCGNDAELDETLEKAARDCEDLGDRLMVHVFRLIGEATRARDEGEDATGAFSRAARACEAALRVGATDDEGENVRERRAFARFGLSTSLRALGDLSDDAEESIRLFARAVEVGEEAARAISEEEAPHEWAAAQSGLADALYKQALFLDEEKTSRPLYERAIKAGEAARRILKKRILWRRRDRHEWAELQKCLATSYLEIAMYINGEESHELLVRSVKAHRSALRNVNRKAYPMKYTRILESLGLACMKQGSLKFGKEGRRHLDKAADAFQMAYKSVRREEEPLCWVRNQARMGSCLRARAAISSRMVALILLSRAVVAYESSLKLLSHDGTPKDWAVYHDDMGDCLFDMAHRCSGETARRLFSRAQGAYEEALKSVNRKNGPHFWASLQTSIAATLRRQAIAGPEFEAMRLLASAQKVCEGAMRAFDSLGATKGQGLTRSYLATIIGGIAVRTMDKDEALALYKKAIMICEEGVKICKRGQAENQRVDLLDSLKRLRQCVRNLESI